jgi:hypothetical protein
MKFYFPVMDTVLQTAFFFFFQLGCIAIGWIALAYSFNKEKLLDKKEQFLCLSDEVRNGNQEKK